MRLCPGGKLFSCGASKTGAGGKIRSTTTILSVAMVHLILLGLILIDFPAATGAKSQHGLSAENIFSSSRPSSTREGILQIHASLDSEADARLSATLKLEEEREAVLLSRVAAGKTIPRSEDERKSLSGGTSLLEQEEAGGGLTGSTETEETSSIQEAPASRNSKNTQYDIVNSNLVPSPSSGSNLVHSSKYIYGPGPPLSFLSDIATSIAHHLVRGVDVASERQRFDRSEAARNAVARELRAAQRDSSAVRKAAAGFVLGKKGPGSNMGRNNNNFPSSKKFSLLEDAEGGRTSDESHNYEGALNNNLEERPFENTSSFVGRRRKGGPAGLAEPGPENAGGKYTSAADGSRAGESDALYDAIEALRTSKGEVYTDQIGKAMDRTAAHLSPLSALTEESVVGYMDGQKSGIS